MEEDAAPGGGSAKKWLDLLKDAEQADRVYQDKCDSIDKLFADLKTMAESGRDRQLQIFWANLEVLKPAIYSRAPVPVVTSRFKDRRPLPRRAAEVVERALISDFEADDLHDTLIHVRDDLVISSRGVPWVRLGQRDGNLVPICEHVDRKDFRHGPARKWREVPWVARRSWLTREKMQKRFGDAALQPGISYEKHELAEGYKSEKKTEVWELWHREENNVVWVSPGAEDVLDQQEPWLSLTGFYPCPRPAYATVQRSSLIPVPDFVYYKDQIEEINEMTARISALAEALRLKGFYPAGNGEISEAIEAAMKTLDDRAVLVPVSSFAALSNTSLKDSIIWLPVREVAEVIVNLVQLRKQLIEDVYQITGISDIMRGETAASETLGAQQLKSQYGNVRVKGRQEEMARIARDVTRMKAEILAEEVPFDQLLEMAQIDDLPSQADVEMQIQQAAAQLQGQPPEVIAQAEQQAQKYMEETVTREQVQELLQSQRVRPFVLDIETDSTVQPDENAEKANRSEFLTAVGGFLAQATPMVMQAPQLGDFVASTLRYVANGYRCGREMDMAVDALAERMREVSEHSQEPPEPDPVAEAELEDKRASAGLKDAQTQEIMFNISQPDQAAPVEPVSVDPMDEVKAMQADRKLDQDDRRLDLEEVRALGDLALRVRQENNPNA